METSWERWTQPFEKAMDGLSVALTERDKDILRDAVGIHGVAAMREP
jgi:hypothetical protein